MTGGISMSDDLLKALKSMSKKMPVAVRMYAETAAKKLEASAKQHAPWTDRTRLARITLRAYTAQIQPGLCEITIAHGVTYGVWLELAHEKRFATIMPTIQRESPAIMRGFSVLLGGE